MYARSRRPVVAAALALATLAAACSSKGGGGSAAPSSGVSASVASYELIAARPQRFIVGLLRSDNERLVSFGTVRLRCAFLGAKERPLGRPRPGPETTARWLPIPGQSVDPNAPGPRFVQASAGTGVYGAEGVVFDAPGFWSVTASAVIDGRNRSAVGQFSVVAHNVVPAPGDPAPNTSNPLPGAAGVPLRAIDSRADESTPIPDPELHSTTVAAALAAHKPLMVVVSTPTYCQSRFCGPITDSVAALARRYGDRIAFVHLEVWRDFQANQLNPAAQDWIDPKHTSEGNEPWTFVVGADGIIKQRFDNVATDEELRDAVRTLVGA